MRRLAGLDVNGWRDVAARDAAPDDVEDEASARSVVEGGVESVAVHDLEGRWLGGPQAAKAPHGRGPGWGDIGKAKRRVALRDALAALLSDPAGLAVRPSDPAPSALRAAVDALVLDADDVTLLVPDLPASDEAVRTALLAAAARRGRRVRLLWRPVAAFLAALDQGEIDRATVDSIWQVIVHDADGLAVQTLRLRRDQRHPGHFAPEREGYGCIHLPELGLAAIHARAEAAVAAANPVLAEGRMELSRLAGALLLGEAEAGALEILRRDNGSWACVEAPALPEEAVLPPTPPLTTAESPVAGVLLLTPLRTPYAEALAARLGGGGGDHPPPRRMPWESLARGALSAGHLIERGLPHYYDRLEPIHLAVLAGDEPEFAPLIPPGATLPANREYVSAPLRGFVWSRQKTDVEFYIAKGELTGMAEIRHLEVEREVGPARDATVELRLRQTPGQSWARLTVSSPDWEQLARDPVALDWAALSRTDLTPDDVLNLLRTPPPVIPEPIVEPPDIRFWVGGEWFQKGLGDLLKAEVPGSDRAIAHLAEWLPRRIKLSGEGYDRVRPIGTDGALPPDLDLDTREALAAALSVAERQVIGGRDAPPLRNNRPLQALTWTFTGCPVAVQDAVVEALQRRLTRGGHRLFGPTAGARVVTQGAGRAVVGAYRLGQVLGALAALAPNNDTIAALQMILTRRPEAPDALDRPLVDRILDQVSQTLEREVRGGNYRHIFSNCLLALAGVFRWRRREPYALLADREPSAARIRDTLLRADAEIARNAARVTVATEKRGRIREIVELFEGRGDADVLRRLDVDD